MSTCEQVHPFADGELNAADEDAFREHLGDCTRCRGALAEILQLAALARPGEGAGAGDELGHARRSKTRRRERSRTWMTVGVVLAAAAALVLLVPRWRATPEAPPRFALAATRQLEGRLSYAGAEAHRPYDVARSGDAIGQSVPAAAIAALERAGDAHGVATAYLLDGNPTQAASWLARTPPSDDVDSDRAALALAQQDPARAVALCARVLEHSPRHAEAQWNRALALAALGLEESAAASFDEVVALGEPGWADEARDRAARLRAAVGRRKREFDRVSAAGLELTRTGTGLTIDDARASPGLARLYFNNALRAAPDRARVLALRPLAHELDLVQGGGVLVELVDRTAALDFSKRGPLGATFANLVVGGTLTPAAAAAFLERVRASGDDFLFVGALLFVGTVRGRVDAARLGELRAAAARLGDPWTTTLAAELDSDALADARDFTRAEAGLRAAAAACQGPGLDLRCARLEQKLADLYTRMQRLGEAAEHARRGWQEARRSGAWAIEHQLLSSFAEMLQLGDRVDDAALADAYLDELDRRAPGDCAASAYVHEARALLELALLHPERAQREEDAVLATTARCGPRLTPRNVLIRAELLRRDGSAAQVAALRADLAHLRETDAAPARLAFYDQVEGRLLIEHEPELGRARLEAAIARATPLVAADQTAGRARGYSYAVLALDAARRGDGARTLALLAEELGAPLAERCVVGVAIEDRATAVIVRGGDGRLVTRYDEARRAPTIDVAALVPTDAAAGLAGCEVVDVLARPPVQGRARLLPSTLAWRYLVGAHATAANAPSLPPRRVVVADAEPPASLGLPHVGAWTGASTPELLLVGAAATPSRVLAAMRDATEIEIHAHGLVDAESSDASFLALSPDGDGSYALTAAQVRADALAGRPLVLLGACRAAQPATWLHQAWSLPAAFVAAGARSVLASPAPISDREAGAFMEAFRKRVLTGVTPAVALRDVRASWPARAGRWVDELVIFE
jgi:hypothetical protein